MKPRSAPADSSNRIWVTWENQRRSKELAEHFGCSFHLFSYVGWLRYPKSISRTFMLLLRRRPDVLFVQNPSMILAALAVLWGMITSCYVVVDRHTTFLLNREYHLSPGLVLFKLLHRFTVSHADVTVVTNDHLASLVADMGGRPYVLQDKFPRLDCDNAPRPVEGGTRSALLISSFGADEPIDAAVASLSTVQRPLRLFISGNLSMAPAELVQSAPANATFTGFLPEDEFVRLLCGVDMVLVLSTADYTLLCGCYEAYAAGKPLVTSDKQVLREYFRAAIFVDNSSESIAAALDTPQEELRRIQRKVEEDRAAIHKRWLRRAAGLDQLIIAKEAAITDRPR